MPAHPIKHTRETFWRLPGIGPKKIDLLLRDGVTTWHDVQQHRACPENPHLREALDASENALNAGNILYLANALHRGEKNLNGFLDLLNDIAFLVTFNGASFDIPQLEFHFRRDPR